MSAGILNRLTDLRRASYFLAVRSNQQLRLTNTQPKYLFSMNEAYLRYDRGDKSFQFSFRYTNADLNVDRQFNLSRSPDESIAKFLKRLDTNLDKILAKKRKRKAKKNPSIEPEPVKEDYVESGDIALLRNEDVIDLDVPCQTLFENPSQITLRVFGTPYKIKVNVPWITSMGLPGSILAGFPVYPADFEAVHTDKTISQFIWYRNCSKATTASQVYQNAWEEVGKGYLYTPTVSDIDCRLKLRCVPANQEQTGPIMEAESPNTVEAGPGQCPFETRHVFTREKLTGRHFRVTSYNILADVYASTDYSRDVLFPYCPPYALAIDYRKQLIIKELIGYNSDIICLQEVDRKIFETDLYPTLSTFCYGGIFTRKGEDLSEGVATFYDERRFEKIRTESRVMSQNVQSPGFGSVWEKIENETVKERFLGRNTTVQATVLRSKDDPSEILVVGNTHLYFQPDADHIRLLQGYYALTYCQEIARETRESYGSQAEANVRIILCGDFNSTPDCGIYQLMTTSHVPEDHKDWSSSERTFFLFTLYL